MAESFIQVPPDSTGKEVCAFQDSGGHYRQCVVIGDPDNAGQVVSIGADGLLPIKTEVQFDGDSGGGTELLSAIFLALPASGGPVVAGTPTAPINVIATTTALPSGAATSALQTVGNNSLASILTAVVANTTVIVTGTVTANIGTIPAGLATSTNQVLGNNTLSSILTALASVTVTGTVTANIGTIPAGLATSTNQLRSLGTVSGGLAATSSALAGGVFNTTQPTLTDGQQAALQLDTNGNLRTTASVTFPGAINATITNALTIGTITPGLSVTTIVGVNTTISNALTIGTITPTLNIGTIAATVFAMNAGAASSTTQRVILANDSPNRVVTDATTSGGYSPFRDLSLTTTPVEVKGSAGQLYFMHYVNRGTAPLYVKFFDVVAANVVVGTSTPIWTITIPANATDYIAGQVPLGQGLQFSTAISVICSTGVLDNSTVGPAANVCVLNLGFK